MIDLANTVIGLGRTERSMPPGRGGPPKRLDGHTISAGVMTAHTMPPHAGERHPDGDEILFMVSGSIDVDLEFDDGAQTVRLGPGDALVVPRGVWHLIHLVEPGRLLNITPGPHGDHRPLPTGG